MNTIHSQISTLNSPLPPGYKQTEVGVIPDEWDAVPLKGKVSITHGFAFASQHFAAHGPYRLATPGHFYESGGFRDVGEKQKYYVGPVLSDYVLQPGDVIVAMTEQADGLQGSTAVIPNENGYLHNQRLGRVRTLSSDIDLSYLVNAFNSPAYRAKIRETAAGTKVKHTSPDKLLEIAVRLPPLPEQRAIAKALSDVDGLLGGLDRLIAKKRDLKQAAMQQLLTGQTRLPGFHGEWEVKRLGEVADVKTGPFGSTLHESDYVREGTPIITVEHLGEFGVEHINLPLVSDSDRQRLIAYSLEIGDIVFSRVGSVDRNALIRPAEEGWLFSGRLLRVRPIKRKIFAPFLSYQFHSETFVSDVRNVAVGQTMACLNTQLLKGIPVLLPSVPEQTAIAEVLTEIDGELAVLEQRREKTRALKQAMMQELLTGRTRLV